MPTKRSTGQAWLKWLVVAVVAVPALLFCFVGWQDRQIVLAQAEQRSRDIVAIFDQHARNVLETHKLVGALVNERIRGMAWEEIAASANLHDDLQRIVDDFPQVQSIWLADSTGRVRATNRLYPVPGIDLTDRDYFQALSRRDVGVFIGRMVRGHLFKDTVFNVAQRRATTDGHFDGVIDVGARPSYLLAFWEEVADSKRTTTALIRTDGSILARNPPVGFEAKPLPADNPLMRQLAKSDAGVFWGFSGFDGQQRLYTYKRLAGFPVVVGHGVGIAEVLAPWRSHLLSYGAFFLLATSGFLALALIVARRVRDEALANRIAARFRGFLAAAPDAVIVVRQDGSIGFANSQAYGVFGYPEGALEGMPLEHLIPHAQRRAHVGFRRDYWKNPEIRAMAREKDVMGRRHDGSLLPVEVTLSAAQIDDESLVIALVRDISERRRLEAELENSRAQVVASARLSALGTMAGGIAHEINNPLAVIHARALDMVDRIAEGRAAPGELRESAQQIADYAERIARIVASMRRISRDGEADPCVETKMSDIIVYTLDVCRERFCQHSVELSVPEVDPDLVLECRDVQIAQTLINLLQNALDAVLGQAGPRWVRLDVDADDESVVIKVVDNGPGIPPDLRDKVMEPFFTTKPPGSGTGLGLSLSRRIAVNHGGTLEFQECEGYTCFALTLPKVQRKGS